VLLSHYNAHPHAANTNEPLQNFKWEVPEHPPYKPHLASSDFHLLGPLKHHLSAEHIPDEAAEREVTTWFQQQPKEFYASGFQGLLQQWDKCLTVQGDYVEK
jgi:hypothetical protein